MNQSFERNTTMRQAFFTAKVGKQARALTTTCLNVMMTGAGVVRERGWNAALSFRTATQLKKQGVL